ncbi:MAG TPA: leucyl aminopeptidase, partial [Woeseiaceae bacterium]|nr:leucyl aminopeptidase [Woeseiaceae bacterium]
MEHFTTTTKASRRAGGCLIVGVFEEGTPGVAAADIDSASDGTIRRLVRSGDLSGRLGEARLLTSVPGIRASRVVVTGLGKKDDLGIAEFRQATQAALGALKGSKTEEIVSYLPLENVGTANPYYLARYTVETVGNAAYSFSEMKSGRQSPGLRLKKTGLAVEAEADRAAAGKGAQHADAIVTAMSLAKDLGNLPPNVCTPGYLARTAQRLAREQANLQARVLGEAEMKRLGMQSLLAVTKGSDEPAKLIVMQYKGAPKGKPVVLVGKGITFDTGGLSLKPGPGMDEMKYDMCGAASVIATLYAVSRLGLPLNVTGIVPSCENLPSGSATRPGDIVKSMSGQTIEILNTDAEGRLILCDALTYARRFKPAVMIDVATLTGACVIALGHHMTAIMSNRDELAKSLSEAGVAADDRGWHMPMSPEYERQLNSNFADFANVGGREGGAITAACFLGKFTKDVDWAHLDIAGTAWLTGSDKGATGRP